jgi:5-methylcytosine-specific restriction endonuclease McrA
LVALAIAEQVERCLAALGRPPDNEAHIYHIKPQAKNGSGTPENGQVLCSVCNLNKSDSWVPYEKNGKDIF